MPDFSTIFPAWHAQMVAHIHYLGHSYELETGHRPKNNLTDVELSLFYRQLFKLHQGAENWKQHYAAWVLIYITSTRPGSFTVAQGYEAGASLGASKLKRSVDETMRWSDVVFVRMPETTGISARVTFRYLKMQRNPYTSRPVIGQKTFTFLPTRGERYEFDLSAILTALAFSRGLFPFDTLEELYAFEPDRMYLPTVEVVSKQAVFLASNQAGTLEPDTPMREGSLNLKLHQMCESVGLLGHNTVYSLRRTAIIEARRAAGVETAREFAGHAPDTASIISYDTEGMADFDATAFRLGEKGIDRATIRQAFAQAKTLRVDPDTQGHLQEILNERATTAMESDEKYIQMESELNKCLLDAATLLDIEPLDNTQGVFATYRKNLKDAEHFEAVQQLDDILKRRHLLRKMLLHQHKMEHKRLMLAEHEKAVKNTQKRSKLFTGSTARQPAALRKEADAGLAAVDTTTEETELQNLTTEDDDGPDRDPVTIVDARAIDEAMDGTRDEPEHWKRLADDVVVRAVGDGDGEATLEARMQFMKAFAMLMSVPNSNMRCKLCFLDPTTTESQKSMLYTKWKLDRHLKGTFHSRKSQLSRAGCNAEQEDGTVQCPSCDKQVDRTVFLKHITKAHPEQM